MTDRLAEGVPANDDLQATLEALPPEIRATIDRDGLWHRPSAYGDPYPITRALLEDGRRHLLLHAAVPGWARLLRPGGAMGIAWNTHVASRERASGVLEEAGLTVVDSPAYRRLRHRVDQAILRDVLVARRPA